VSKSHLRRGEIPPPHLGANQISQNVRAINKRELADNIIKTVIDFSYTSFIYIVV
jgi:hypothetical protein